MKMKMKLTDASGQELRPRSLPKPKGAAPVGMQILVELLTPQEALGSDIVVSDNAKVGAPQGIVIGIGPKVDKEWGVHVGDRVVLVGSFTPLPELDNDNERITACVEPHTIKAVLSY